MGYTYIPWFPWELKEGAYAEIYSHTGRLHHEGFIKRSQQNSVGSMPTSTTYLLFSKEFSIDGR